MRFKLTSYAALLLLMLVTGLFWGTWFAMTRSLHDFSAAEFIHIGKVIIANVAWPMRIIMPLCLLLMLLSIAFYPKPRGPGFYACIAAFLLLVTSLLITLLVEVPIDNMIKTWTPETIPSNWKTLRMTWDTFHTIRTFTSLAGFALFAGTVWFQKK